MRKSMMRALCSIAVFVMLFSACTPAYEPTNAAGSGVFTSTPTSTTAAATTTHPVITQEETKQETTKQIPSTKNVETTTKTDTKQNTTKPVTTISPTTTKPAITAKVNENTSSVVYVTETGTKYHRGDCGYLNKSKIAISLQQARQAYSPCSKCSPPK